MPDIDIGHGAGKYSRRLIVQQNQPTTDNANQPIDNWVEMFRRWAQIIPKGGSEKHPFLQLRAEIDHLIRIRSSLQNRLILPADWRFQLITDGATVTTFNIDSRIDVDYRKIEIEFRCIEVQK